MTMHTWETYPVYRPAMIQWFLMLCYGGS